MGVGSRITKEYGNQIVDGLFHLLSELGIWSGKIEETKLPIISTDGEVTLVHAEESGIFIPNVDHWDGMVFSLREYPIVYQGSLILRILGGGQSC